MQTSAYHVEKSISDGSTQRRAEEKLAFLSSTQNRTADKREREALLASYFCSRPRAVLVYLRLGEFQKETLR